MKQQLSESYLSTYYWHEHDSDQPWLQTDPQTNYKGTITTQCDAGDYAVGERDNAAVEALADAKKVVIKLPNGIVSIEFRFRFDGSAGDQHVLQMSAAAGVDHYRFVAQLTLDQGTQVHTTDSIYFIDTVVPANESWKTYMN